MSRQLTFSATVCVLTLALFALVAGQGAMNDGLTPTAQIAPLAIGTATE
ncbi:hypothetical protein [Pelagerythrobacter aerophilus]|nr:hypothetical protein [Pelagerythrobacter aerophilus]